LGNRRITAAVILVSFFIFFHARAVGAYFANDEMMNIFGYWDPPFWKVVLAQLAFWSKFYRPMGAVYYLPLYEIFGLNPVPYNVVRLLLLAANTTLFYVLAKRITSSWWIATLAALPVSYHAGMTFLAYRGSFIYDILCAGFYFAALLYYLRQRKSDAPLNVPQTLLFLILYICALNSKEMAVSLPVLILAYELLFHRSRPRLITVLIAVAITVIYITGKAVGPGTLTELESYRPVFTWTRFVESNTRFLNTLFYTELFTTGRLLILWSAILLFAALKWRWRDPRWMFLWLWVVVTPLPIAFLPARGGAMLYIPAAGWALLTAMVLRALARRVSKKAMPVVLVALAVLYAVETRKLEREQVAATLASGAELKRFISSLNSLGFRPRERSRIVFLNDPFPDGYATEFAAYLVWNDHSLDISLERQVHLPPDGIAGMDYIFDFVDERLVVHKPGL
jgi:hypothetical protein